MLQFVKMHALGNDFMLVDARNQPFSLTSLQISALADRHEGVGFDQLLCLEKSENQTIDALYRIFNADGQEVGQCGNGARCAAHYLYQCGKSKAEPIVLSSQAGLITVTANFSKPYHDAELNNTDYYRAALAVPSFKTIQIPLNLDFIDRRVATLDKDLLSWSYLGNVYQGGIVNVGNPHWIIPVDTFNENELQRLGAALQVENRDSDHEALFPEGVNVTWARIENKHEVRIETYERGVGLTRACGSAAAATAVVAISQGWCDNPVRINVHDGHLMVEWDSVDTPVFVTGPAVSVFQGEISA